jgi:hypothetical protein
MKMAFTPDDIRQALGKGFNISPDQIVLHDQVSALDIVGTSEIPAFRRRRASKPVVKQERLFVTDEVAS